MDEVLQPTPLTAHHEAAGGRLGPFAGWAMPIRFGGTLAEHEAVRTDVGVFDVSHLGTVWIDGPDAGDVVAAAFTNDPARLSDGGAQYTLCCDDAGGVVDDLIVYRLAAERWLAIPNAANTPTVVELLEELAADRDAHVRDESRDWAVLAIQGPRGPAVADAVLAAVGVTCSTSVADLAAFEVVEVSRDATTGAVARTGYTGEAGCELVLPGAWAVEVWEAALAAGAVPCGLAARDTLRLEMGLPLHGNELSTDRSPFEARLGWAVKVDRGGFRGAPALARQKAAGPARRLWGLRVDGRRPARADMEVSRDGVAVGRTTSGTLSPTLGRPIALAYLDDPIGPGDEVELDLRGSSVRAEVVRPPFLDRSSGS